MFQRIKDINFSLLKLLVSMSKRLTVSRAAEKLLDALQCVEVAQERSNICVQKWAEKCEVKR